MGPQLELLDPQKLLRESVLEVRGDGKAGGGLVLAFQTLAALLLGDPDLHVQEWPFFSSARRGACIRSFLRVSRRPVTAACEVTRPAMVLLMDEGAARTVDFAEGVPRGGTSRGQLEVGHVSPNHRFGFGRNDGRACVVQQVPFHVGIERAGCGRGFRGRGLEASEDRVGRSGSPRHVADHQSDQHAVSARPEIR